MWGGGDGGWLKWISVGGGGWGLVEMDKCGGGDGGWLKWISVGGGMGVG